MGMEHDLLPNMRWPRGACSISRGSLGCPSVGATLYTDLLWHIPRIIVEIRHIRSASLPASAAGYSTRDNSASYGSMIRNSAWRSAFAARSAHIADLGVRPNYNKSPQPRRISRFGGTSEWGSIHDNTRARFSGRDSRSVFRHRNCSIEYIKPLSAPMLSKLA
jgi:hypothetical protein